MTMKHTEYNPDFFIPTDLDHAKNIILTPENTGVDLRWTQETEWTSKVVDSLMNITEDSVVLDWGCGVGRISKMLIDKYGCKVIGVDLQPKMLELAQEYVNDERFSVVQYSEAFTVLPQYKFTHVFACWALQHSNKIQYEIPLIYQSMDLDSQLFVLEIDKKAIPNMAGGYYDDGVSSRQLLEKFFDMGALGKIPLHYTTRKIRDMSWWAVLDRKMKV